MMNSVSNLKKFCLSIGLDLFGVIRPQKLKTFKYFVKWLENGNHAGMEWIKNSPKKREDLRNVLPGCNSVIVLGVSYFNRDYTSAEIDDPNHALFARYAWGDDYHIVLKKKAKEIISWLNLNYGEQYQHKFYADTGPLLEREMASLAGLGFIGKNSSLINEKLGSYFFITSIFSQVPFEEQINEVRGGCGTCTKCLDSCPTGALVKSKTIDARKCIAYHTVENRGEIPKTIKEKIGNRVFGCDICQEVCPWNRFAKKTKMEELETKLNRDKLKIEDLKNMTVLEYQKLFKKSAVKRAKFSGMKRNCNLNN